MVLVAVRWTAALQSNFELRDRMKGVRREAFSVVFFCRRALLGSRVAARLQLHATRFEVLPLFDSLSLSGWLACVRACVMSFVRARALSLIRRAFLCKGPPHILGFFPGLLLVLLPCLSVRPQHSSSPPSRPWLAVAACTRDSVCPQLSLSIHTPSIPS